MAKAITMADNFIKWAPPRHFIQGKARARK
jgi:hypothetical protein